MTPEQALQRGWGFKSFLPLQREAVDCALSRRDCLVVLPTGGGKSLCYQLPAAMGRGLVLVVSPLIALMDDQVAAAREAGIAADALHSNLDLRKLGEAKARLAEGRTSLLFVSPERLLMGDVAEGIAGRLSLVAVDEAHCVSHWGHEFRPEYRRLHEVLECLPKAARMALTATATPEVREDILRQLALRDPALWVGHPDRPNLVYRAFPRREQLPQVLETVRRHEGEGGIVYAHTRRDVERLAEGLKRAGVSCAPYHAGLPAEERSRAQKGFVNERIDVIVATIAFGMGIDRSNVRFVVHANAPRSVEHYQQESGRAGRDGLPAECVLLFSASDLALHRRLAFQDGLSPERRKAVERQLREIGRFGVSPVCRHRLLAEHFGARYPEASCGACDVCLGETRSLPPEESLLTAQKILSAAWRCGGRFGAGYVARLLLGRPDERMRRWGHDSLGVFGLLKDSGEAALRSWMDQLIVQGFLEIFEQGEYPLLRITEEGKGLCRGLGSVRLGAAPPAGKKAAGARRSPPSGGLFERLRALRRDIAEQAGVPPYLVFHDLALSEMAERRPKSPAEMLEIKGVGERKLARYGAAFLRAISAASTEKSAR